MPTPPSTGYDSFSFGVTADVDDFTFKHDLALEHANWWTANDTADGTKGLVFDSDGSTQRASDWMDFDNGAETGIVTFQRAGTTSALGGPYTQRFYVPMAANPSVGVGDTYGQYNAYVSTIKKYWPGFDGADRTSIGDDLTAQGGLTFGTGTGKVGSCIDFEASSSHYATAGTTGMSASAGAYFAWVKPESLTPVDYLMSHYNGGHRIYMLIETGNDYKGGLGSQYNNLASSTAASAGTWVHIVVVWNGGNSEIFIDGVSDGTGTYTGLSSIGSSMQLAAVLGGSFFDGLLNEIQVHSTVPADDWIAEDRTQTNDQSAYWGAPTWTAAAAGIAPQRTLVGVGV